MKKTSILMWLLVTLTISIQVNATDKEKELEELVKQSRTIISQSILDFKSYACEITKIFERYIENSNDSDPYNISLWKDCSTIDEKHAFITKLCLINTLRKVLYYHIKTLDGILSVPDKNALLELFWKIYCLDKRMKHFRKIDKKSSDFLEYY